VGVCEGLDHFFVLFYLIAREEREQEQCCHSPNRHTLRGRCRQTIQHRKRQVWLGWLEAEFAKRDDARLWKQKPLCVDCWRWTVRIEMFVVVSSHQVELSVVNEQTEHGVVVVDGILWRCGVVVYE
jgi:hypothetical protein